MKIVNELAEEEWTPVVRRKGEVKQLKKGDGTRINPVISSDKELSLASARDITYHNVDGTSALVYRLISFQSNVHVLVRSVMVVNVYGRTHGAVIESRSCPFTH